MLSTELSTGIDASVPTLIHIVLWINRCNRGRRRRLNTSVDLRFHRASRTDVPISTSCTFVHNVSAVHCCRAVIHTLTHTVRISPGIRSAPTVPERPGLRCRGRRPHTTASQVSRGRRACHGRQGCRHRHALVVGSSAPPTICACHGNCHGTPSVAQGNVLASLRTIPPRIEQNPRSSTSPTRGGVQVPSSQLRRVARRSRRKRFHVVGRVPKSVEKLPHGHGAVAHGRDGGACASLGAVRTESSSGLTASGRPGGVRGPRGFYVKRRREPRRSVRVCATCRASPCCRSRGNAS